MEMYRYIKSILTSQPIIVMSWGMHEMRPCVVDTKAGLQFQVQGFKHTGLVAVLYNEGSDAFEIQLQDQSGLPLNDVYPVYLDELVDRIDDLVEKTPDYAEQVTSWMNTPDEDQESQEAKDLGRMVHEVLKSGGAEEIHIIG